MSQLTVHLLPRTLPAHFDKSTAVVIDVLRATTTIVAALANGAKSVVPVADVPTARAIARRAESEDVLLGGERGGEKIPGFDLDNSPLSYTAQAIEGRHIIFTTSHGTQAITWARVASQVLIASFSNLTAVVQRLAETSGDLHLVCSGTDNLPSIEDSLCAATIAGQLWERRGKPTWVDDTTLMLLELYHACAWSDGAERLRILTAGRGGQRLTRLGCEHDIARAAEMDTSHLVPYLDSSVEQPRIVSFPGRTELDRATSNRSQ